MKEYIVEIVEDSECIRIHGIKTVQKTVRPDTVTALTLYIVSTTQTTTARLQNL